MKNNTIKLQDSSPIIGNRSRQERYWQQNGFNQFYKKFRTGLSLPKQAQTVDSLDKLIKLFKLNAVGFGNWVTLEDRHNYVSALKIALYDIDKIIKFKQNIGLNNLVSFSFGARGRSKALAHFEPTTFIINVTRYKEDADLTKEERFLLTGGAGSIAHEYGHALDYYFGLFVENGNNAGALSGGSTVFRKLPPQTTPLRIATNELLDTIIWQKKYSELSSYYKRILAATDNNYWFGRNEIFARCFEKYIQYKLAEIGIVNSFLHDTKYDPRFYPTNAEIKAVVPLFDALIKKMASKI